MSKVLKGEFRMQNRISYVVRSLILSTLACFIFLGLLGCEDKDTNAVAKAQECLDKARVAADAVACRGLIEGKSSQQAYIVRCSIEFVAGGLITSKIAQAFTEQKNAGSKKEATLISFLSLGETSTADNAAAYCKLSGIPGLIYLANLSVIGTYMTVLASSGDPSAFLSTCISGAGSGSDQGTCNNTAIGTAVISIADSYCTGDNSTSDVCSKVNTAITSANGSPEEVARQFYEQLGH
ncbi:MAG: hypothetical protein IPJ71_08270 [Bdellovibrionales bacterium]|nr:hypothetical protein [Bdellovibrionales bacterium]